MSEQKQKLDPREGLQALNALGDALEHLKNASQRFEKAKDKTIEVKENESNQETKTT